MKPALPASVPMWISCRKRISGRVLSAVGKVTAIRRQNGAEREQDRYYLLSETCSAERFNYIVRGHWGIEKSAALGIGCDLPRGSGAEPEGALRGEPGAAAEAGAEFGAVGGEQRLHAWQAEAGGLGRWLSHQHPVSIHQNPYAIALDIVGLFKTRRVLRRATNFVTFVSDFRNQPAHRSHAGFTECPRFRRGDYNHWR